MIEPGAKIRVGIVGSREYIPLEKVWHFVRELRPPTVVVSGGATGPDSIAAECARANGLEVKIYLPDWERYGKRAGLERNTDIVYDIDLLVAFWDGKSRGTLDTIKKAAQNWKTVIINP